MHNAYATTFYSISVATLPGDVDAHSTLLIAEADETGMKYSLLSAASPGDEYEFRAEVEVTRQGEPVVCPWALCVAQCASAYRPHQHSSINFVSVSVYSGETIDEVDGLRLLEHLVVHRQGTRLLVEFSNEDTSIERVGPARASYASSFDVAVHAIEVLEHCEAWPGKPDPDARTSNCTPPQRR